MVHPSVHVLPQDTSSETFVPPTPTTTPPLQERSLVFWIQMVRELNAAAAHTHACAADASSPAPAAAAAVASASAFFLSGRQGGGEHTSPLCPLSLFPSFPPLILFVLPIYAGN